MVIVSQLTLQRVSAAVADIFTTSPVKHDLNCKLESHSTLAAESVKNVVSTIASKSILNKPDAPEDYQMPAWMTSLVSKIQFLTNPANTQARRKLFIGLVIATLSAIAINKYLSKKAQKKRAETRKSLTEKGKPISRKPRVAVDAVFFRRLKKILKIVIPSVYSTEFAYLTILTVLLVARTVFSIYIAELIGVNAQSLVSRKWGKMWRGIKIFALLTIPASAVNSLLKYFTEMLSLRFRLQLSEHVHSVYLNSSLFYKATNLGGPNRIDNADQRVTSDIKMFSDEISQLYSSMLKPTLDVILFTTKLAQILGFQAPLVMHAYFFLSGYIKKNVMPNLGKLTARESELEGVYRTAHNRLITNSEEISFYGGAPKEKIIITQALHNVYDHIAFSRYLRALIGILDGLLVKYYASLAGYATLLSPLILNLEFTRNLKVEDLTRDYIRNSQYLGNLSNAVGQLVLVGNKLTTISGYTARVSELLEMVEHLNTTNLPFELKPEEVKPIELKRNQQQTDEFIKQWKVKCEDQRELRLQIRSAEESESVPIEGGGVVEYGDHIEFQHVDIVSPEGKLLVSDLTFRIDRHVNVMVTGPNGCGKSSLFRVIGQLWPLSCGKLVKPHNADILFVPQKPYLVAGTLRDQIIYPHSEKDMHALGVTDDDLAQLLAIVDPAENILKAWTWDTVADWFHAFSGGQKQRVALCRTFYHCPAFAILDECTSAVSDEVESTIYESCRKLGITIFTVSHRAQLARFHDKILRFEGNGGWTVLEVKHEPPANSPNHSSFSIVQSDSYFPQTTLVQRGGSQLSLNSMDRQTSQTGLQTRSNQKGIYEKLNGVKSK